MSELIDYPSLISRMALLSPAVQKALDTESYLLTQEEDESTPESIASQMLDLLVQDLADIGITLTTDLSAIYHGWDDLELFIELTEMIFPSRLTPFLQQDNTFLKGVEILIEGGDGLDMPLIQKYLDFIGNGYPSTSEMYQPAAQQLCDHVSSSQAFETYLLNIITMAKSTAITSMDPMTITQYLQSLNDKRTSFFTAIDRISKFISEEERQLLDRRVGFQIKALTTDEVLVRFSWMYHLDQTKGTNRTDQEDALYQRYRTEQQVSGRLFTNWWIQTGRPPERIDLIGMLIWEGFHRSEMKPQGVLDFLSTSFGAHVLEDPKLIKIAEVLTPVSV